MMLRLLALRVSARRLLLMLLFSGLGVCGLALIHESGQSPHARPDVNPLADFHQWVAAGKVPEALALYAHVQGHPSTPGYAEIMSVGAELEASWKAPRARLARMASGFFTGHGDSPEGLSAAVVSDFLVVGDVRDLAVQGAHWVRGDEADGMIAALSAVGVAASLATWVPEPASSAAGSGAQGVLTGLKAMRRSGAVSQPLQQTLKRQSRQALASRSWAPLRPTLKHASSIFQQAPPGTTATLLRHARSRGDLASIDRALRQNPHGTVVQLSRHGASGMTGLARASRSPRAFDLMLRKGLRDISQVRFFTRGGKFLYRGRHGEIWDQMVEILARDPRLREALVAGTLVAFVIAALFGMRALPALRRVVRPRPCLDLNAN